MTLGLTGMNFGVTDCTPSIWLGTTTCSSTSWTTNTQLICITPINMGATVLVVDVDGNTKSVGTDLTDSAPRSSEEAPAESELPFDISFDSPVPTYGSPLNGPVSTVHASSCTHVEAMYQDIISGELQQRII